MAKSQDIINVEVRLDKAEDKIDETRDSQDKMFLLQGEMMKKLDGIHDCLAGTEFDRNETNGKGGGVMRRLSRAEQAISIFKIWKIQVTTKHAVIWIVVSAALAGVWSIILFNWGNIFNK